MMIVTVITPFPELLGPFSSSGVIGKAVEKGLISIRFINPRDHTDGHYGQIDDYAYGGGGMVLMAEPLARAVDEAKAGGQAFVVHPGPQGVVLGQHLVESLASKEHLVIVCGRYEGVDERFVDKYVDLEVSIGDYVLTGGELPAMVIIDAVARLIPGVVGQEAAVEEDSFFRGMLDTPHYTRPSSWRGSEVPGVLTGGDHVKTSSWRRRQSVARTLGRRPDMIARANIGPYLDKGVYVILVPARREVTLEEAEAIADLGASFGCERAIFISTDEAFHKELQESLGGKGKVLRSPGRAIAWIRNREKEDPFVIVCGSTDRGSIHWLEAKRLGLASGRPIVFLAGEGAERVTTDPVEHVFLGPVRGGKDDRTLSAPRDTLAVILDRFFGRR